MILKKLHHRKLKEVNISCDLKQNNWDWDTFDDDDDDDDDDHTLLFIQMS